MKSEIHLTLNKQYKKRRDFTNKRIHAYPRLSTLKKKARFETIIRNDAAAKRKRRTKKPAGIIPIDSKPQLIETPKDKYGIYLVSEEGSKCPNDGCPHMLYGNVNGRPELIYDVVEIDPDEPSDDPNNLIALCPDCAAMRLWRVCRNPETRKR